MLKVLEVIRKCTLSIKYSRNLGKVKDILHPDSSIHRSFFSICAIAEWLEKLYVSRPYKLVKIELKTVVGVVLDILVSMLSDISKEQLLGFHVIHQAVLSSTIKPIPIIAALASVTSNYHNHVIPVWVVDDCRKLLLITPGGGASPSTASWILLRCRGVDVVGFLQNNTGRGVGVPRRLRREKEFGLFLPPSPDSAEFGKSGLRWLSLSGVEVFLPPSPDYTEFGESGLRWLSLPGVELFWPSSPDSVEFGESGLRWLSLSGVEVFLSPSPDSAEFGESGLRWLSLSGVELFLPPSRDYTEFGESGLRWLSLPGFELFWPSSPDSAEFGESGLRWLSLSGVELFLPPSPDYAEFGELGLRWLSLPGVELFWPSSPDSAEFGESGLRWLSLSGVEVFFSPNPDSAEFGESGLRWLSLSGVEFFLPPSPDYAEFGESGLRWLSLPGVELFWPSSPDSAEFGESGLRWLSLLRVGLFLPPSPDCIEFCESGLRFMVWTKALAKAFITCYPGPSSSDSESSADSERVEMGKRASTLDSEAITKLTVAKISSRKVPCSPEGLWVENLGYFISKSEEIENSFYFRSIRSGYARQLNAHPEPYDREAFDRKFVDSIVSKEHYELKDEYAALDYAAQDSAVRAAFQLDPRVEWRWPTPDERAHHRAADGFISVWLEHLRSGWNPHWHLFLKHLGKYVYKLSPMQITPNGIKWMTWFIATCNQFKVQPTFKLWHHIFHLVRSSQFPLYELRFRAPECGYGGSYRPVIQQSSLKYCNGELIMLRGLDLHYLPHITSEGVRTRFRRDVLRGEAIRLMFAFCESLGFQMTRDTFMNHRTMHRLGCLPHYNPDMSSSAYSDALKGSGSNASAEEASQSNAVPNPEPEVFVNPPGPELDAEVEIGDDFANLEDLDPIGEAPGGDSGRRRKRVRTLGSKPPRAENFEAGSGSGASKRKNIGEESPNEGGPGLEEKVARFMTGIPTQTEWRRMNESGFDATMKECSRLWGQLGGYMAGSASLAYNELKGFQTAVADKDAEISQLRDQIIVKDNCLSGLNKHLNEVTIRAKNAENEASDLKSELAELRREMSVVRPESEVIAEFKRSEEYDRALANAGAPEIARCWLIAERHIKTNPEADWDSFVS
ncbi:hypothetical protein AgCh_021479 [Apium graveolens]